MNKDDLLKRCKELGIEIDPENKPTNAELKELIKEKEAEIAKQEEAEKVEKLTAAAQELEIDTDGLTTSEDLEKAINEKAELIELTEKAESLNIESKDLSAAELKKAISAKEKEAASVFEADRGLKWEFKKSAPKTINIDGKPMTQEEILQTKDVMAELVYGNSNFLIQKH